MKTLIYFGIISLVLIGLFPTVAVAQADLSNGGLILDEKTYETFPFIGEQGVKAEVPPKVISLKEFAPYPNSQGNSASCVGWAVGYGAMTIYSAIQSGVCHRDKITYQMAYSPAFIYNQIKKGKNCQSGASLEDALQLISQQGVCFKATFDQRDCNVLPDYRAKEEASGLKINGKPKRLFFK